MQPSDSCNPPIERRESGSLLSFESGINAITDKADGFPANADIRNFRNPITLN